MGYNIEDLLGYTIFELREIGRKVNLKSYSTYNKETLVKKLVEFTNSVSSDNREARLSTLSRQIATKTFKEKGDACSGFLIKVNEDYGELYDTKLMSRRVYVPSYLFQTAGAIDGFYIEARKHSFCDHEFVTEISKVDRRLSYAGGTRSLVVSDQPFQCILQALVKEKGWAKCALIPCITADEQKQIVTEGHREGMFVSSFELEAKEHSVMIKLANGIVTRRVRDGEKIVMVIDIARTVWALEIGGMTRKQAEYEVARMFTSNCRVTGGGCLNVVGVTAEGDTRDLLAMFA